MATVEHNRSSCHKQVLSVENFGPLTRADIDLCPLSVFVGPSNSGKSFLAVLIYALHRFFGQRRSVFGYQLLNVTRQFVLDGLPGAPINTRKEVAELPRILRNLLAHGQGQGQHGPYSLPSSITAALRSIFSAIDGNELGLGTEIARCFGLEAAMLPRKNASGSTSIIMRTPSDASTEPIIEHKIILDADGARLQTSIPEAMPMKLSNEAVEETLRVAGYRANTPLNENEERHLVEDLLAHWVDCFQPTVYRPFDRTAYYLPADRPGIMRAHAAFVHASLGVVANSMQVPPMFSGVVADFLSKLVEPLESGNGYDSNGESDPLRVIGARIEKSILDGSVLVDNSSPVRFPQFRYRPMHWDGVLPLTSASSMVSDLAPIVLYLRHYVRPGDVLIIEEPEAHVHPAAQVEFTRELAAIVTAGVRVIVTTHSEWILEALANLVNLSSLPESSRKEIDGGDVVLYPEQVGAWLFKKEQYPGGSTVQRINLDESGLYPTDFSAVAEALYKDWTRMVQDRLED